MKPLVSCFPSLCPSAFFCLTVYVIVLRIVIELFVCTSHQCLTVITQWGDCSLMEAARRGETEVVSLLVKAGAALDLQNKVRIQTSMSHSMDTTCSMAARASQ